MKRQMKKVMIVTTIVLMCFVLTSCVSSDYKTAIDYFESGEYSKASELFDSLGNYKDSREMRIKATTAQIDAAIENGEGSKAMQLLEDNKDIIGEEAYSRCYNDGLYSLGIERLEKGTAVAIDLGLEALKKVSKDSRYYDMAQEILQSYATVSKSEFIGTWSGTTYSDAVGHDYCIYVEIYEVYSNGFGLECAVKTKDTLDGYIWQESTYSYGVNDISDSLLGNKSARHRFEKLSDRMIKFIDNKDVFYLSMQ